MSAYRRLIVSISFIIFITASVAFAAESGVLRIVDNGKPSAVIVVPDSGVKIAPFVPWGKEELPVSYAADFLKEHIKMCTGAELAVVTEKELQNGKTVIALSNTVFAQRYGIEPLKLPSEGFVIKSIPEGIVITGQVSPDGYDRGTLFGIYTFLETFCGIRWYFPGEIGTVVPKTKDIQITLPVNIAKSPYFPVRMGGAGGWGAKKWHPVLKYGMTQGLIANHTTNTWKNLYGKTHPEYFGVDSKGNSSLNTPRPYLCYTQPGVLQQYLKNIRAYVETGDITPWRGASSHPQGKNIPFGPNDTWTKCACPECSKLYQPGKNRAGRCSNYIFSFAAELAREMKKIDPELRLWVLTYQSYLMPPDESVVEIPDNLCITLCLYPTTTARMAQPRFFKENQDLVNNWQKLLNNNPSRLIVWNYFISPNGYLKAPVEHPHVQTEFTRFLKNRSIGIFCNGMASYEGVGYNQTIYAAWIMHKLLWEPELDVDRAREDFCRDLFGPASGEMLAFFRLLEDRWEKVRWQRSAGTYVVPTLTAFMDNYPLEVAESLKKLLAEARVKTPENSIYRKRVDWFDHEVYRPFIARTEAFHAWRARTSSGSCATIEKPVLVEGAPDTSVFSNSEPLPLLHFDGLKPWHKGRVKTAFDRENLYIEAQFESLTLVDIKKHIYKRDQAVEPGDRFVVQIQSEPRARREYLEISVSAEGKLTYQRVGGGGTWTPSGIKAGVVSENGGWTVRLTIPWEDINVNEVPVRMRMQFLHHFYRSSEYDCWCPTLQQEFYPGAGRFGWLNFVKGGPVQKSD
jgi:hypothetical protein